MSAIKESSDELNPVATVSATESSRGKFRSATDYLAVAVATCGVGFFPIAPGTLGAMVGVAIYLPLESALRLYFLRSEQQSYAPVVAVLLLAIVLVTAIGVWAASRVEGRLRKKDPSIVVIDEVAGQMIALLSISASVRGWFPIVSAFILFRVFDIWKPYPIRRLESLESGLGIMADDVLAGIYALIVNSLLIAGYLLIVSPRG